ncbi:MAG: DNA gyrase subunit A [Maricaulaceae bacterium]
MTEDTPQGPADAPGVAPIAIEEEMSRSYLDYAMSVIVARAIPDARDGLKPVHRRILWAMHEAGYVKEKPYRKSARIVGDVVGKYHPHGEGAVYDALVRLAQPFSMAAPLIDGQGNFGSVDGDPPAAMRYTESRLEAIAGSLLADIDKNTVDFLTTYDNTGREPQVLPARFPNLLVNGAGGIAVGMATNVPPHNLGEVITASLAMLETPEMSDAELLDIVPGPVFPTGALIIGRSGSRSGLTTGRGSVVMRGVAEIEEIRSGRYAIIVTELPYQVNKAALVEKIADLVRDKRIEGVSDLRDESDRRGMRVVIELKRDAVADVVLNQLYRFSALQTNFGYNMLALNNGRPEVLTLRALLQAFLGHREIVIARRTKFDLAKARDRAHVLVGLAVAVANIDEVIALIRTAPDPASARAALMDRGWPARDMEPLLQLIADPRSRLDAAGDIRLTEEQARAILDLRLQRLTALGRDEIGDEAKALAAKIADLLDILRSRPRVIEIIRNELEEIKDKYAIERRTRFIDVELEVDDEALIAREEMVVTVTHGGYVKRTPLADYRTQRRGGRGRSGMTTADEDFVNRVFVASTHAPLLLFSSAGMAYKMKVWRLPQGDPRTKGKAFVNLLPLGPGEVITSVMALPEDEEAWAELDIVFATRSGQVRRNKLSDFVQVNRNGKIAMKLDEGDGIIGVQLATESDDLLIATALGRCIRFPLSDVRVFAGRTSTGVRAVKLAEGDRAISMTVLRHVEVAPDEARAYIRHANAMRRAAGEGEDDTDLGADAALEPETETETGIAPDRIAYLGGAEQFVLTVAADGYGKRTSAYDYRAMNRGAQGLLAHDMAKSDAELVASFPIDDSDEIMLVTDGGQLIRCPVDQIRVAARNTRGVRLIRLAEGERVVSVERVAETGADKDTGLDEAD